MDHSTIKQVIFDQHDLIRRISIIPRNSYSFDPALNHVLIGVRRAGKSFLLYREVQKLIASGKVDWDQIVFINFEDERLTGFQISDFNDILVTAAELSDKEPYFFFDEIQIVKGWESFARRLADQKRHVWITGSNAAMLSSEIAARLGGRYLSHYVSPYSFEEYLDARGISHQKQDLYSSAGLGRVRAAGDLFRKQGGLPESISLISAREYSQSVLQKILLNDIALRHGIRNPEAIRILSGKIASTITTDISYTRLRNTLTSIGYKLSLTTLIEYVRSMEESFLLFSLPNITDKFAQRETNKKYYFTDNGLLSVYTDQDDSALLENVVASALYPVWKDELSYLKSSKTGIDLDFVIPSAHAAVQVCTELNSRDWDREISSLDTYARYSSEPVHLFVVTLEQETTLQREHSIITVLPLWKFLLYGIEPFIK